MDNEPNTAVREPRRWHILIAILFGSVMGPLDSSIVYTSLPTLADYFSVSLEKISWISMAYLIVMGGFLLPCGKLGDLIGFRKSYLVGLLVFVIASLFCSLSSSLNELVIARVLQAIGAAMSLAMAPAIITATFAPGERGKALGIQGMLVAVGLAVGPGLGGFLIDYLGWPSIFWINMPLGIVTFIFAYLVLPKSGRSEDKSFDWAGSVLGFLSLALLIVLTSQAYTWVGSPSVLFLSFLGIALTIAFIRWEMVVPDPILDLGLFRNRVFSWGILAVLFNFIAQYVAVFLTPFLLQSYLHYSAAAAGTIMTAFPFTVLFTAPIAGSLSDRYGSQRFAALGCFICAGGIIFLSMSAMTKNLNLIVGGLIILGLGTGAFQSPNTSAVLSSVKTARLGAASGVMATSRTIGMVLGISIASNLFSHQYAVLQNQFVDNAFAIALMKSYQAGGLMACLAGIFILMQRRNSQQAAKLQQ